MTGHSQIRSIKLSIANHSCNPSLLPTCSYHPQPRKGSSSQCQFLHYPLHTGRRSPSAPHCTPCFHNSCCSRSSFAHSVRPVCGSWQSAVLPEIQWLRMTNMSHIVPGFSQRSHIPFQPN